MNWIMNNWYIIFTLVVVLAMAGIVILKFCCLPSEKQMEKVREWLLYAVSKAEKELGSGTGKLKLRYVYDMFLARFWIAKLISFGTFSDLVDIALDQMRGLIESNNNIKELIEGEVK